jgi:tRNA(fMet)-specific endonuclease VapC
MSGRYLLDTNIVIALFASDPSVQRHISEAEEIFIPATVIGELFFGAFNSTQQEKNISRIEEFAQFNAVLSCGLATGKEYGCIKALLKRRGTPVPENDIWIAAVALEHDLTLVSRDQHFNGIDRLRKMSWM